MSDAPEVRGEHAPGSIPAARRALLAWVDAAGPAGRRFLQLHLLGLGGDRYRVCHVEDAGVPPGTLTTSNDPYFARHIAQTTADGAHRPLKTEPDLRRGWSLELVDGRSLWVALDYLYPASAVHWFAEQAGTLRITHWGEVARRQSGMYSAVKLLPEAAVRDAVHACCADAVCLRRVAWGLDERQPEPLSGDAADVGSKREPNEPGPTEAGATIPCPEACSLFISFAREVLTVERSPRAIPSPWGELNGPELYQIRSLINAVADGTGHAPRTGEFTEPLNHRRIRYLDARLEPLPQEGEAEP